MRFPSELRSTGLKNIRVQDLDLLEVRVDELRLDRTVCRSSTECSLPWTRPSSVLSGVMGAPRRQCATTDGVALNSVKRLGSQS